MLQIKPFVRVKDGVQKDGKAAIYFRFTYKRRVKSFSTRIKINPDNWDFKNERVKKSEPLSVTINSTLTNMHNNMMQRYYEMYSNNEPYNYSKVLAAIKGNNPITFFEYATKELSTRPIEKVTKKGMQSCINNVQDFSKNCLITDIDTIFLNRYRSFLSVKKGHSHNTITSGMSRLRTFINAAIRDGVLKSTPFDNVKVGSYQPKQLFLSMDELMKAYDGFKTLPKELGEVCKQFCFMCFTSLRYSDLKKLDYTMLQHDTHQGFYFFSFKQQKTKNSQSIPLSNFALQILDTKQSKGKVFKVSTNQYFNRALKDAFVVLGIEKVPTSHMGRHTFITLSMQMGVSKDIAGKIAGHKRSNTTDGYAHLQVNDLFKGMQKWNNMSPDGG